MVRAVVVEFNLHVGFLQHARTGQLELQVLDGEAAGEPHGLVVGLDGGRNAVAALGISGIEVGGAGEHRQVVVLNQTGGVGEKEIGVGLQVDDAAVGEEAAIAFQEPRRRQPLAGTFHLRVAERQPYLLHFVGGEETVDELDAGAQECHILDAFLFHHFCAGPHACSLDVNANVVLAGKLLCKPHGILSLAASQLKDDGVIVMEVLLVPLATHGERSLLQFGKGILEDARERLHIGKFLEFVLSHIVKN